MDVFTGAKAGCSRRTALRTLAVFVVLSSPWIAANAAPVLSGAPATKVMAAHYYSFQPGAVDPGKKLTFSILNKPYWAQFDSTTGRVAGTPIPSAVGTFSNIVISASDGAATARLAPFSITVQPLPNIPPKMGGTPATAVVAGHAYSFQPTASDPNGLQIGFGIFGKPSWASFDATTGRLSGTPTAANVGSYPNIIITVYDGYAKAVLPTFSITVQAAVASTPTPPSPPVTPPVTSPVTVPTTGSATVSWVPPTQNSDGSVLANLSGYRIYYGTSPSSLTQSVTVANSGLTRYAISGLATETWYFSMTAYNALGMESARTAVATFAVR
jgi:hypothetical protein